MYVADRSDAGDGSMLIDQKMVGNVTCLRRKPRFGEMLVKT